MLFRWYTARFFTHTRAGNDPAILFSKKKKWNFFLFNFWGQIGFKLRMCRVKLIGIFLFNFELNWAQDILTTRTMESSTTTRSWRQVSSHQRNCGGSPKVSRQLISFYISERRTQTVFALASAILILSVGGDQKGAEKIIEVDTFK